MPVSPGIEPKAMPQTTLKIIKRKVKGLLAM
jgi:hypothetical protein